jgi:hypothetical protein
MRFYGWVAREGAFVDAEYITGSRLKPPRREFAILAAVNTQPEKQNEGLAA